MKAFSLAVLLLLLPVSVVAEDSYVPLSARTELQLTNRSAVRLPVAVEVLGSNAPRELSLEPGQSLSFSEQTEHLGVVRIAADAAVEVKAVSHCDACGSRISVPVLHARDALSDVAVAVRAPRELPWRSDVLVVNPESGVALVNVSVSRRDEVVDQSLVRIPPGGIRRVRLDGSSGDVMSFQSPRRVLLVGYDSNDRTGARVFTPVVHAVGGKRRSVRHVANPVQPPPDPQTIVINPSKDNTLFESNGTVSNGQGVHLFAGNTAGSGTRRALVAFDVASQIPPGATITKASLRMEVNMSIAGPQPMTLHRVQADWGEGASDAGSFRDGAGAQARTGDATWLHRFFSNQLWTNQGGDFDAAADATTTVDDIATWGTSVTMVARVQSWLDQPATNFGWLVRGNETQNTTAKRFASREHTASSRPALTIEFIP